MKEQDQISIQFLGAAQTVTGSRHLIRSGNTTIMVDSGLFQGEKELRLLNWQPLPVKAKEIDLVLLTHGHLDHTGYLPCLVKQGFAGEIWGTAPTNDITRIVLMDSAHIQEEDAAKANEENYSKHKPALPLYTVKEVESMLPMFKAKTLDSYIPINDHISCRFNYNGHIPGATFIELKIHGHTIVFSGDIGRPHDPVLYSPQKPQRADVLVLESTYGDRINTTDALNHLAGIVNSTVANHGSLIIPSFAVERSQLLLYMIAQLKKQKRIPGIPVYFDSPMALEAMEVLKHYPAWHKLTVDDFKYMVEGVRLVQSLQETHDVTNLSTPKIVIAGSGMASGGRVLAYMSRYIGDKNSCILLAGYQAKGTRGRALLEGAEEIKMFGKYFPVKASIQNLEGISAHADQEEILDWLDQLEKAPQKIFLVHGEPESCAALKDKIRERYGYNCEIPLMNQKFNLS